MLLIPTLGLLACTGPEDTGGPEPTAVIEDLAWSCPNPTDALAYTDVGAAWGLIDTTDDEPMPMWGSAVGLVDVDGDRDDDVLIAPRGRGLWLQRNEGDRLVSEQLLNAWDVALFAAGDVDGDRDLDLWVGSAGPDMYLLRNDGTGRFTDDTAASKLGDTFAISEKTGADFADVDNDGDLDLVIAQSGNADESREEFRLVLLRNDGTGAFENVGSSLDTEIRDGVTWIGLWSDLDVDGDPDLFLANDLHHERGPSRLVRNDGPAGGEWDLTDVTDDCYCGEGVYAMGASVGDYDGDGLYDLFITATGPNQLLKNDGDLLFLDTTLTVGASMYEDPKWTDQTNMRMSLGSAFVDYDNDGWLDLMAIAGRLAIDEISLGDQDVEQPNRLLRWLPEEGYFTDVAAEVGVQAPEDGRGVAFGLLDHDGYPDLLVGNLGAPSPLYQSACGDATSLVVELVGSGGNTYGVGARVSLTTSERTLVREVRGTHGLSAAVHPRAWFGLGDEAPVSLEIQWPGGTVQEVDLSIDASGLLFVEEPAG